MARKKKERTMEENFERLIDKIEDHRQNIDCCQDALHSTKHGVRSIDENTLGMVAAAWVLGVGVLIALIVCAVQLDQISNDPVVTHGYLSPLVAEGEVTAVGNNVLAVDGRVIPICAKDNGLARIGDTVRIEKEEVTLVSCGNSNRVVYVQPPNCPECDTDE